ncbi:MAG: glycosyltransferase family 2 protein [Bacilli bacterium]
MTQMVEHSTQSAPHQTMPAFFCLRPYRMGANSALIDPVDPKIAKLVSPEAAREFGVLPIQEVAGIVYLAVLDCHSLRIRQVADKMEVAVHMCLVESEDLRWAQDRVYGLPDDMEDRRLGGLLLATERIKSADIVKALELQRSSGSRIGALLTSTNSINHWDVAKGLARQAGVPLIDLLNDGIPSPLFLDPSVHEVWNVVAERFWTRHLAVPLFMNDRILMIAMADPFDAETITALEQRLNRPVKVFVTGYRDIAAGLKMRYGFDHERQSREALLETDPENSAHKQLSKGQIVTGALLTGVVAAGCVLNAPLVTAFLSAVIQLFYFSYSAFRFRMMYRATKTASEKVVTSVALSQVDLHSLPAYTILVPLYKETAVLPVLTKALMGLHYPKDRLDVKLLLESDDIETIQAAKDANLPNYIELVLVPASLPRTKPKACNYGLMSARGEYVVIYDAEDIPEPDQLLKAIAVFRQSPDEVACVQAKLSYFNHSQNALTRWFTAEYANWFDLLLPGMFSMNVPIPLGGTSNHFRTETLREMGAWDPYNVTEDADLGIRLHKARYRTLIMDSTTYEEANADFVNWIRQRSRWVKGYIQTWLVHMRHPVALRRELGLKGFLGFQMIIGGTPLVFLLNPIFWIMTFWWFVFGQNAFIVNLFPSWVYYLALLNLAVGNFAFMYANIVGLARRKRWELISYAILSPIYWAFMSIGAWKGLLQLITRPSYWEKTIHGLSVSPHSSSLPYLASAVDTDTQAVSS